MALLRCPCAKSSVDDYNATRARLAQVEAALLERNDTAMAVAAEAARYREALDEAARSLESISMRDILTDIIEVRQYAVSRARVAREALAGPDIPRGTP